MYTFVQLLSGYLLCNLGSTEKIIVTDIYQEQLSLHTNEVQTIDPTL